MMPRIQTALLVSTVVVESAMLVLLAQKHARLRRDFTLARVEALIPQPGNFYPQFDARAFGRDTVIHVGRPPVGQRELVLVYSRTCQYCRESLQAWRSLLATADSVGSITPIVVANDSVRASYDTLQLAGIAAPVVLFPSRRERALARAGRTPQTVLLDSDGRILASHTGLVTDSVLQVVRRAAMRFP
jgi:hypothetical protein